MYTQEEVASLFTTDTDIPCDYNITKGVLNSDTILENKSKITQPMGIHSQSKHKYRHVFGDSNIKYHDFNNGDALTFKDEYYYNRNYKTCIGVFMTLSQPKATKYLQKCMLRQCHMQCIFLAIRRPLQKYLYWCFHGPITTKSYQISSEMYVETMPHAMYFPGNKETIAKIPVLVFSWPYHNQKLPNIFRNAC